ncbi:MAG: DUF58 domain-containing protein [Nitrospinota bacterium]|nr:DUF58 domain-containing protein [Nitrospinota bacterium]
MGETNEDSSRLPREIFRRIRRLEIKTRKLVEAVFSGEYHSVFKGSGMEFAEVRQYNPGDDVRSIDWNVTARSGKPFIKVFNEERELTVILMVDASASGNFGTEGRFKMEAIAELCATLAFSAIRNGDKVGLLVFTGSVELFIPPSKGRKHVLRIIREILFFKPQGSDTNVIGALERLSMTVKRKAIVFLISDFVTEEPLTKPLSVASKRHDVIAVEVFDPAEKTLPDAGLVTLLDAETGEEILVDSSNPDFRIRFDKEVRRREMYLKKTFGQCGVDHIPIPSNKSVADPLVKFFKKREKRLASGR